MSLLNLIGFGGAQNPTPVGELPDIFPFPYREADFVKIDVENIYARILTDVLERTQGIPAGKEALLWDNCVANESSDGLVTLVSKAMTAKADLFLVYEKALDLIRKATASEEAQIKAEYQAKGESKIGVYLTFKNYHRTDMIKLYSVLEYCTVAALHKSMNLSKAVQFKASELRSSVASSDASVVIKQAQAVAEGLKGGKDILIDAKDLIETAKPDLTAAQASMDFIAQKRSFYLGLPASYITGLAPKGLGDSGEGDAKAVERGLKGYFFSIVKPTLEAIFGGTLTFKSDDFTGITTSLQALKDFEITSDELMSQDNKRILINKLFGLPADAKGDKAKPVETPPPQVSGV